MRKTTTQLLILLIVLNLISCNSKGNDLQTTQNSSFKITKITKSSFERHGDSYKYNFIGEAQNNSTNIYDDVYTTLEVQLELENGSIITEKDYDSGFMTGFGDTEKVWKSSEVRKIDDHGGLDSDFIPAHYKEYKVKKVVAIFDFSTEDIINHTKDTFTDTIDITKQWEAL
ncbi:hypothetical protein J2810_002781 [Chryseobacterium rhizosphaerae]|uniref:hypothetical protein n=1 Tax=Chryseobacterium rhizosphaerae TaxID=395937 RepID=UPI0028675F86|nr:hypothetical protein [Chryseobacterium rhizosphaerae]MDR6546675.1 hypothetical protein [Chryseobacterium rhizosphaerae]MDR6546721.1 hypothetical protein [Chryseobacterium rhizosphaerae]